MKPRRRQEDGVLPQSRRGVHRGEGAVGIFDFCRFDQHLVGWHSRLHPGEHFDKVPAQGLSVSVKGQTLPIQTESQGAAFVVEEGIPKLFGGLRFG